MSVMELVVNEQYLDLVPRPTKEERRVLKHSIMEEGQREPIIINQNGIILDGHTRFEICQELNIVPKTNVRVYTDKQKEMDYVITANLLRRNLNAFQKAELVYRIYKDKISHSKRGKVNGILKHKTRDSLGEQIGISGKTLWNAIYVIDHSNEKTLNLLRKNHLSIYSAYTQIKNKEAIINRKPRKNISVKKLMEFYKHDLEVIEYLTELLKKYTETQK